MEHSRDRPLTFKVTDKSKKKQNIKKTLEEKVMSKKIISIALVIITLFSTLAISANAASYSSGTYVVIATNGVNVRTGPSSSYSRVGAASKNVKFYVSKVSGSWGYTDSIQCTNGTRSGWVSLDYCSKQSSVHTHNYNGGRYYQTAHPHEISVRCTEYSSCGGWKWTGENYKVSGCSQCYPATNVSYYVEITANSGLVLRSGAGTSYTYLTAIPKGKVVQITQENNGWGKTSYNGKTGWISLSYTKKTSLDQPSNIRLNVPLYKQGDSRWSNVYIGTKTIGNVGCLTTAIAMVYSYNTGKTVYPNTARYMLSYSNNDLYWSSLSAVGLTSKSYNCSLTNSMMSTIYSKLKEGRPVIIGASTSSGSYQHWVVITGYTGSSTSSFSSADFTVNDPGSQGSTTLKAFLANGSYADRTRIIRIVY